MKHFQMSVWMFLVVEDYTFEGDYCVELHEDDVVHD